MTPSPNAPRNSLRFREELSRRLEFEKSRIIKHYDQNALKLVRDNESQLSQSRESLHTVRSVHVKLPLESVRVSTSKRGSS